MINILPYNHKKLVHRLRFMRVVTVTVWAFIILIWIAILLLVPLLVTINSRFSIAQKQIAELEKNGAVISQVDVASFDARTATLLKKLASPLPPAPTDYLMLLDKSDHPGITLSGFSMESTSPRLEVSGIATTREALQRFIATLEKTESIISVESPVSNFVKSTNSQFNLTVTFK